APPITTPELGQQRRPAPAGPGKDRPVGEDRHDELLQGLRGEPEMTMVNSVAQPFKAAMGPRVLGCTLVVLLAVVPAFAQSPNTSTIVVLVTDPSGAVVSNASVVVTNSERGTVRAVA